MSNPFDDVTFADNPMPLYYLHLRLWESLGSRHWQGRYGSAGSYRADMTIGLSMLWADIRGRANWRIELPVVVS